MLLLYHSSEFFGIIEDMRVLLILILIVAAGCNAVVVKEGFQRDLPEAIIKERLKEVRQ
jgi:hypothetical protein